ncbi:MAG: polyketide synthase, partial [Calditrichaeota bacterium]
MNQETTDKYFHEIAVISMACRYPGARNLEQFWHNLREGVESISFFSDEELLESGVDPSLLSDPNYVKANSILENIDLFDASFFGYTPREAELMDPQHRVFLEVAWEALERAGYDSEKYQGLIGVFCGSGKNYYFINNLLSNQEVIESTEGIQLTLTNDKDFLPTNVSYKLNLRGPSINIQTACSTSLVAIHLACQSLLNGECDIALAGGVSITELKKQGYLYQEEGIYSADGHCRTFDARATGMVGGNGVGIVVLKRLADALNDGDQIYAVVKGSAVNNDGSLKVGFTAPSVEGQARVIAEALAIADVQPDTITFVETHGTATALGDPIEVAALTQAFRAGTKEKGYCALGAVKTNVGHTNAAAGVAGFIKTVLALYHKEIPPTLHFDKPNPKIELENSPFFVNTELLPWKTDKLPRRAGVSAFGMGGTNAHVILEEAPVMPKSGESRPYQLILLSARTKSALETITTNLVKELQNQPEKNLADVAYTLQIGRRCFSHRRMLVCQNINEVVQALQANDPKIVSTTFNEARKQDVVFMFPGQGSQYVGMGRGLYEGEPLFRRVVDECS